MTYDKDIINLVNTNISKANDRFNNDNITNTIKYCVIICNLMLNEVLNKSYYPMLSDDNIEHIKQLNINAAVANVLYPYFTEDEFITKFIKSNIKEAREYEVANCLLYLEDDTSIYQNVLKYLYNTFINVI